MMNVIKFDKKCTCGPEFVCVRIIENCDNLKVGNIYLPSTAESNARLAHCIIEDIGVEAAKTYGLKIGDYVMIDRLSTFAHTSPIALLRYNNVIMKTNSNKSEFWPLKNMVFVEPESKRDVEKIGRIFVTNYEDKLNIGTITKMNCEPELELPFKEGDKVLVTKGADVIKLGMIDIYIYKHDMLIAKIED